MYSITFASSDTATKRSPAHKASLVRQGRIHNLSSLEGAEQATVRQTTLDEIADDHRPVHSLFIVSNRIGQDLAEA